MFKRESKPLQNIYYTPGERFHKNEKLIDAVIRKAKEEIDINIEPKEIKYCGIIEEFFDDSSFNDVSSGAHNINIVYNYIIEDIKKINISFKFSNFLPYIYI